MRIFHGPFNIGNQGSVLSRAEKKLIGKDSGIGKTESVNFSANYSVYPADYSFSEPAFFRNNVLGKVLNCVKIFFFGLFSLCRYDLFHFYFGRTFLGFGPVRGKFVNAFDLMLLKMLGKKIFITYQGCDVRQRTVYQDLPVSACKNSECQNKWCNGRADNVRRKNISRISKYADKVFCLNPDLVPLVAGSEFLPYTCVFPDILPEERAEKDSSGKIRILHAPSDRAIKGTRYLEAAVERLKEKYNIDLILVENKSQDQLFQEYQQTDILVDQLLVGWYGSTSVEGMAFGVPVVSFINRDFLKYIPAKMAEELPIVFADPESVYERLEELINDKEKRESLSKAGQNFFKRWHDPDKIAEAMVEIYKDPSKKFADIYDPDNY